MLAAKPSFLPTLAPSLHLNWSLKKLHRLIVLSNAYQQSSAQDAAKAKLDPENKLLWRMNARRLDAEALRDSILRVSGTLNGAAGGPAIRVPLEPEVYSTIFTESEPDNLWPLTPDPRQFTRRSIYLLRKRNVRLPLLAVFDQPDMMSSCAARGQSVHALQSLTLLNSPFMQEQSEALAARLFREEPLDESRRVERLYLLALGRSPKPAERDATTRFLREQTALVRERITRGEKIAHPAELPAGADPASAAAWVDLSLAMLNLNDFVYVR